MREGEPSAPREDFEPAARSAAAGGLPPWRPEPETRPQRYAERPQPPGPAPRPAPPRARRGAPPRPGRNFGGPDGNERLTAATGAVLLALFAAEGFTLLSLRRLLFWHFFLGLLLIGPVALKIGSTVYRFARYYSRDRAYVRKGPPRPLLRVLGPFVILSTVAVLGTGVLLGLDHGSPQVLGFPLLFLHKLSFLAWAAVTTVHVLAYLPRLPALLAADVGGPRARRTAGPVGGRGLRLTLLALALGAGLVIAEAGSQLSALWRR